MSVPGKRLVEWRMWLAYALTLLFGVGVIVLINVLDLPGWVNWTITIAACPLIWFLPYLITRPYQPIERERP